MNLKLLLISIFIKLFKLNQNLITIKLTENKYQSEYAKIYNKMAQKCKLKRLK